MKKKYSEFKDFFWSQKKYDINSHDSRNLDLWALTYYPYVIFKEENNTYWWLTKIK